MKRVLLAGLIFLIAAQANAMSEATLAKYGGPDNMLMVSHYGRLSIEAPLCNFRSKEWGSKLRAELERRIGANATLTGGQRTNLLLLLASAVVGGEEDWRKDKVTTCDDVKDDLEEGDRFMSGN